MSTHRLYAVTRRKREVYIKKSFLSFFLLILVMCTSILLGSNFADARGNSAEAPVEHKYYKSIEVASGDTLWEIAEEYMNKEYNSINDYIEEVKRINGLASDDIHDSRFLTVAYYENDFK